MRPKWYPDWRGQIAVIVASGPSAGQVILDAARGHARFIAVNESWRLCPWADILFAGDALWWDHNHGCPDFRGIRVTIDRHASERWGVNLVHGYRADDRVLLDDLGRIGGGNSGLNALNLAAQLGPAAILLVGFDMRLDRGLHWHGAHPEGMKNPLPNKVVRWRRGVDNAAEPLAARGIRVINCSPISTLRKFERMNFFHALEAVCRLPA